MLGIFLVNESGKDYFDKVIIFPFEVHVIYQNNSIIQEPLFLSLLRIFHPDLFWEADHTF